MKAAVCHEFGKLLVIQDLTLAPPQTGEVLVRLKACAICHSDLTFADGGWGGPLPTVFGHEAAGIVEQLGPGVRRYAPGDRVLVTLLRSCGHCLPCQRGHPNLCETRFPLDDEPRMHTSAGVPVLQGLRTAAFAEQTVVDQSQLAPIPADLPFDVASLLSCGVITGFGAVTNTARLPPGASTGVIGCGGVGLNAVQGAAHAGAFPLVAMDIVDSKLTTAQTFGATHTINTTKLDPHPPIHRLTNHRGLEYIFTTVGNPQAIQQGLTLLAPAGTLTIVGMPPTDALVSFDATALASANQRILGSKMGATRLQTDIPKLIALYQNNRLKLPELISNRYPLHQINQAITEVRGDKVIRNIIVFE